MTTYDKSHLTPLAFIPGFHTVPSKPLFQVSADGLTRNAKTLKLLRNSFCKSTGYYRCSVIYEGVKIRGLTHRLMAEVFVKPKNGFTIEECLRDLDVNHKDGIKINNDLTNLEWATPSENSQHARDTGLSRTSPCIARNVITGEISKFIALTLLADFLQTSVAEIRYILKRGLGGKYIRHDHVFKLDDGVAWPPDNEVLPYDGIEYVKEYAVFKADGEWQCFRSIRLARECAGCNLDDFPSLGFSITKHGTRLHVRLVRRHPERPVLKCTPEADFNDKKVEIVNTTCNAVEEHYTLREAANGCGLDTDELREKLHQASLVRHHHLQIQLIEAT